MKTKQPGINWIWYVADTKREAEEYYEEITGRVPKYHWEISEVENGKFGFRIHK